MNKSTFRVMMAVYAGSFMAGFIYAFIDEIKKQNLVNHYNNKQKAGMK